MKRTGDSPMSARERLLNAQVIREHGPMDGAEAAELDVLARAIEAEARELLLCAPVESEKRVDGLGQLLSTILRKYGGTMKGRGDHDIFDALVRYRAALLEGEPDAR